VSERRVFQLLLFSRRIEPHPNTPHLEVFMQLRLSSVFVASVVFASLGCAAETAPSSEEPESVVGETSQGLKKEALDVSFQNCSEVASITTLSVAKARTVVPSSFMLAGDASGAPFVVRIANCNAVRIDGGAPEAGTVAQLGISVVSPDGTGVELPHLS
jgi:hypothetical protein